MATESNDTK